MTAISTTVSPPSHPAKPLNPADYRPALVNVGTIVWLASELMFFSGLFAAYLTLRAATPVWPPLHDVVDAKTVGVATVVLVLSSGSMQYAVREVHGQPGRFPGLVGLHVGLGRHIRGHADHGLLDP